MRLSKSLYTRGLQCHKSLWLKVHKPDLLSSTDSMIYSRKELGQDVGKYVRKLFPGGVEIPRSTIESQIIHTLDYIDTGAVTLFNATFVYDEVVITIDIFRIDDNGQVDFFEVKSTTRVKKSQIDDLAIQYYILTGLGYKIQSANVICLNKAYIREGKLDMSQLFQVNDLTFQVKGKCKPDDLVLLQSMLKGSMPEVSIGQHCNSPFPCEAKEYCWQHIPSPSVFDIAGLNMEKKMKLYNQGMTEFQQITDFKDLNTSQMIQVKGETVIDEKAISQFLLDLEYPISHLDFEAYQQAIPEWDGIRPYAHIPFQYSLHIEYKDRLEHKEFLSAPGEDPRAQLAKRLIQDISDSGSVLVYNKSFEKGILKELAIHLPQYADKLREIKSRIIDLIIPFKNKYYYTPDMAGKYSIKKVLPALVPELTYSDLDGVQNGVQAMTAYVQNGNDEKTRTALLKYCELDTLAMVKILEVLRRV